jgi:hypothetical protein
MAEDWSDAELAAAVDAYQGMARLEALKKPYSKKQVYRDLAARYERTEKAFEYRMQNISAVLSELDREWVPGLKPAGHVGENVKSKIVSLLDRPQRIKRALPKPAPDYKALIPAMRDWLVEVARAGHKVEYGEMASVFGIHRRVLRHAMGYLGHQADNNDEPIITAVIVNKGTQHCSDGILREFGVEDDDAERRRLYAFWQQVDSEPTKDIDDTLKARAARFASVEVRPDQAAFRRRVFEAYGGRCAISGCDVVRALDAAHLTGRSWRNHNAAADGILLRKDLHGLYDAKLLTFTEGLVQLAPKALGHYKQFHGQKIAVG